MIATGAERFAVVEARVRPVTGGDGVDPNDRQRLPECAFVFDMQGKLIAAIGGKIGTTIPRSPSPERVDVLSLGPEEDWFVRVARFEDSKPFNYQSVYYRIANPIVRSLKFSHYANSLAWSNGPAEDRAPRHLVFRSSESVGKARRLRDWFNAGRSGGLPRPSIGTATAIALSELQHNKSQTSRCMRSIRSGRGIFQPFAPKPDQLVVSGGAREYNHWHGWDAVVPRNSEALIRLSIPQLRRTAEAGRTETRPRPPQITNSNRTP